MFDTHLTRAWECPQCQSKNEDTGVCQSCSYSPTTAITANPQIYTILYTLFRGIFTLSVGIIGFIIAPIALYTVLLDTQTIPIYFFFAQLLFGMYLAEAVVSPLWDVLLTSILAQYYDIPQGLAYTIIKSPIRIQTEHTSDNQTENTTAS